MMKVETMDFLREDDNFAFIEVRVDCPPQAPPDIIHYMNGPSAHLMLFPCYEGYRSDPVELHGMMYFPKSQIEKMSE